MPTKFGMRANPSELSEIELSQSQWISIDEIVYLVGMPNDDALRALKLRGLATVRPCILDILENVTTLTTDYDNHLLGCVDKILTPHQDWLPDDSDDPDAATVYFHKLAFMDWQKGTDLRIELDSLKEWKRDLLPTLKKSGLLFQRQTSETHSEPIDLSAKYKAKVIRLEFAPGYLGMNKNKFNKDVRPFLNELYFGDRSVGFNRTELDKWVDNQTRTEESDEPFPWDQ